MNDRLLVGSPAPDFSLLSDTGSTVTLSELAGRTVIVYFYPAAMTPGCTKQACDFTDSLDALRAQGYDVLAISPDKPEKLAKFRERDSLTITLLSDPDRAVMKAWFTHSPLYEIFQALATQDCVVVVTTDHGSVLGKRAALVYGNRDTSTNLRYKYGINLNTDPKQAIIVRKPMEYMLPDDGVNKNYVLAREDYYFVYPTKFHEYERQYRGSFQHGGVSVEEMILPLMTLRPKSPRPGT